MIVSYFWYLYINTQNYFTKSHLKGKHWALIEIQLGASPWVSEMAARPKSNVNIHILHPLKSIKFYVCGINV